MTEVLALSVVVLAGLYFCVFAVTSLTMPAESSRFLLGFASSQRAHYIELLIRLLVGWSLVIYAPRMFATAVFTAFGWALIITSACLFLLPWRWHQRFAQYVVPRATRYITLIGLCSLVLGGLIIAAAIRGSAA
ncbi:MAG: DUF2065 family protein [Gammaproteobacteria bacterium]|nr:DUF2065 family protein [Gammaproteobacteria bacterium]MBT8106099.1 DUF2065 family protein [Gammaproteobacteria bacterium]NNK26113.1 DUF2065 family protein [Woeseiaceae bacterium]